MLVTSSENATSPSQPLVNSRISPREDTPFTRERISSSTGLRIDTVGLRGKLNIGSTVALEASVKRRKRFWTSRGELHSKTPEIAEDPQQVHPRMHPGEPSGASAVMDTHRCPQSPGVSTSSSTTTSLYYRELMSFGPPKSVDRVTSEGQRRGRSTFKIHIFVHGKYRDSESGSRVTAGVA